MKFTLKFEELAMFIFGIYLLQQLPVDYPMWLWVILFFSPDIGMLGYVVNTRVGAITYNLFHHKGIALALWAVGLWSSNSILQLSGLILFAHSSFDRLLGYGLKYPDNFKNTHLGQL